MRIVHFSFLLTPLVCGIGILGMGRMAGGGVVAVWGIVGRCLNQDIEDLGILGMGGERLMPVRLIILGSVK